MKKLLLIPILFLFAAVLISAQDNKCRKGDPAPEMKSVTPDGDSLSLSSLRGKLVLVDFWASWCVPCRKNNPHLVELYKKYKDAQFENADGFEIFSVTLDRTEAAWKKAIEKDELAWKYHIWDKDGKLSDEYLVKYIPATFLIDEKGVIIGRNLENDDIDYELERRMKK